MSFIRSMKNNTEFVSWGQGFLGRAGQEGPEQTKNNHRSDENVVTLRSREKSTFVWGGQGREWGRQKDSGAGDLLPLFWECGPLGRAGDAQNTERDGSFRGG